MIVKQDEFDCEEEYCEIIDVTLSSSEDINLASQLTLYPNPVEGHKKGINFVYEDQLV